MAEREEAGRRGIGSVRRRSPGGDPRALIERFGSQMLATARRYSSGNADAEDAFQRAAEIVVKHRPTGTDDELLRWLRTTVKHEALAIRRHRARVVVAGEPERLPKPVSGHLATDAADAHDRAEQLERLALGAQALSALKPQEIRALQLKAEGYSYAEICEITGWTYTKVNRCLSEGRQAFRRKIAGIESGVECERLAPLLSALVDGEADASDVEELRPHLRTCLVCRARLRDFRSSPARVAALAPLAVAAPSGGRSLLDSVAAPLHERWSALAGALQDRAAVAGERLHQATEMAVGQKTVAIAASAAALAGGGAVAERAERDAVSRPAAVDQRVEAPQPAAPPIEPAIQPEPETGEPTDPPEPQPAPEQPEPLPPASGEFGPEASTPEPAPAPPPPAPTPPSGTDPGVFER